MTAEQPEPDAVDGPFAAAEDAIGRYHVERTEDWEFDKGFNVQLNPEHLEEIPDLGQGDYVLVKNPENEITPAVYGYADEGAHLEPDEVGIGFDLRHALGVPIEDSDLNTVTLHATAPSRKPLHRWFFDGAFRYRPIICRVRYAVHPDIGFSICRLEEETFDVLGIEPGDRVMLQSEHDRTSLKALPVRENIDERKEIQREQNPDRYPDCRDLLNIESIVGTRVDLPRIYLDADQRERAGLDETENGGICQPIVVYRDSRAYFMRKLNDVTIPVLAGILGFIVVFKGVIPLSFLAAALGLAMVIILFSLFYEVRFESLD